VAIAPYCAVCGLDVALDDPDARLEVELWICGECWRNRDLEDLLWELDFADGDLDGEIS